MSPKSLEARQITKYPDPISVSPSQAWDGNDGPWSTFYMGFGTPYQYTRVLVSTTAVQPWVVVPEGCIETDPESCPKSRGFVFSKNESVTWKGIDIFNLIYENNLGIDANGDFGLDRVILGLPGSSGVSLDNQVVAGIAAKDFYIATWGIRPAPTNLSSFENTYPSMIDNLKSKNQIASLSWGYTAGSHYRNSQNKQSFGSLTIGGFDAARSSPENVTFDFAPDVSRDLVVAIQSLNFDDTNVLDSPILTFVDAGVPHMWLPQEACDVIEAKYGLTYDSTLDLYLINDTAHDALVDRKASISFSLSDRVSGASSEKKFDLDIPYEALSLELNNNYIGVNETTRYFPLRRAANATQYTLGRAFLQETYLTADYERKQFTLSKALFPDDATSNIQTILPINATITAVNGTSEADAASSDSGLTAGGIAGIVVAAVVVIGIMIAGFWYRRRAMKKAKESATNGNDNTDEKRQSEMDGGWYKPGELDNKGPLPAELNSPRDKKPELESGVVSPELESPYQPLGFYGKAEMDGRQGQPELAGQDVARELPSGEAAREMPTPTYFELSAREHVPDHLLEVQSPTMEQHESNHLLGPQSPAVEKHEKK